MGINKKDKAKADMLFWKFKELFDHGDISSFTYYCRYVDQAYVVARTISQTISYLNVTYDKDKEIKFDVNEKEFNRWIFEKSKNNEIFSNNFYHDPDEDKIHFYVKNGARAEGKSIQICEYGVWRTVPAEKNTFLM